jgi:hypothetical protein
MLAFIHMLAQAEQTSLVEMLDVLTRDRLSASYLLYSTFLCVSISNPSQCSVQLSVRASSMRHYSMSILLP